MNSSKTCTACMLKHIPAGYDSAGADVDKSRSHSRFICGSKLTLQLLNMAFQSLFTFQPILHVN